MIDPDGLQINRVNLPDHIHIKQVPEFDIEIYNLEDDKQYDKYIKDIEKEVRRSDEYKRFIRYLRENLDMNKCAFLKDVSNKETYDIKIEIHHYPFTLRDICEIVYRKRRYYNESLLVMMVAKEVMILHYKLIIGLIPLSETVHELAHSGSLFIPVDHVLGRYNIFVDLYKPFCDPEQLETLDRIEKYSKEQSSQLLNTSIIDQNYIRYEIEDNQYKLPQFNTITDNMMNQIEAIKNNNYMLPNAIQYQQPLITKKVACPIEFDESLIKR
jgi:hypothetical protein